MAEPTKETPLQTIYRLTLVAGVLACGSMAAWHYGPEPGELADLIDQTASMVVEPDVDTLPGQASDPSMIDPVAAPAADALVAGIDETAAKSPAEPANNAPKFDDQVLPASGLLTEPPPTAEAAAPPRAMDRLERERLTAPLLAAGAERADVHPWGDSGNRMYRATASAPVGSPAARLLREFDAIASTPEAAVAAVRSQLRTTALR